MKQVTLFDFIKNVKRERNDKSNERLNNLLLSPAIKNQIKSKECEAEDLEERHWIYCSIFSVFPTLQIHKKKKSKDFYLLIYSITFQDLLRKLRDRRRRGEIYGAKQDEKLT